MSRSSAFRNLMRYLTMGMDFSEPNDFSTFTEAGICLSKLERRELIQLLNDYEAFIVSDEEIETLWASSGARFFISPERARRQFLYIARVYLEQSMLRPDLEDMKAGQTRGKPIERPLTQQETEALRVLHRELVQIPRQTQVFRIFDQQFWRNTFDRNARALIIGIAQDIAGDTISENILELALDHQSSMTNGNKDRSLRELVFNAAFEFESTE